MKTLSIIKSALKRFGAIAAYITGAIGTVSLLVGFFTLQADQRENKEAIALQWSVILNIIVNKPVQCERRTDNILKNLEVIDSNYRNLSDFVRLKCNKG